jgi:hypothetical protein
MRFCLVNIEDLQCGIHCQYLGIDTSHICLRIQRCARPLNSRFA